MFLLSFFPFLIYSFSISTFVCRKVKPIEYKTEEKKIIVLSQRPVRLHFLHAHTAISIFLRNDNHGCNRKIEKMKENPKKKNKKHNSHHVSNWKWKKEEEKETEQKNELLLFVKCDIHLFACEDRNSSCSYSHARCKALISSCAGECQLTVLCARRNESVRENERLNKFRESFAVVHASKTTTIILSQIFF